MGEVGDKRNGSRAFSQGNLGWRPIHWSGAIQIVTSAEQPLSHDRRNQPGDRSDRLPCPALPCPALPCPALPSELEREEREWYYGYRLRDVEPSPEDPPGPSLQGAGPPPSLSKPHQAPAERSGERRERERELLATPPLAPRHATTRPLGRRQGMSSAMSSTNPHSWVGAKDHAVRERGERERSRETREMLDARRETGARPWTTLLRVMACAVFPRL